MGSLDGKENLDRRRENLGARERNRTQAEYQGRKFRTPTFLNKVFHQRTL